MKDKHKISETGWLSTSRTLVCYLCLLFSFPAVADDEDRQTIDDAFKLIEQTAEKTVQTALDAKPYYAQNPNRYYRLIDDALTEITNFDALSLGIMHSALKLHRSDGKYVSPQQIAAFKNIVHRTIAKTYGNALFFFCCKKTEVLYAKKAKESAKHINIVQHVYGGPTEPNVIVYNMHRNELGRWRVHNFEIQGVNIGKEYKRKFDRLYRKYNKNMELILANWQPKAY